MPFRCSAQSHYLTNAGLSLIDVWIKIEPYPKVKMVSAKWGPFDLSFSVLSVDKMIQNSMMTSSNGNIYRVTGPLCGEFTGHRWIPLTKASDNMYVFFDLCPNKRLSKQPRCQWVETPLRSLWRHCNGCWKKRSFNTCFRGRRQTEGNWLAPYIIFLYGIWTHRGPLFTNIC